MAAKENTIAGRSETLAKGIGEAWMAHFRWIEAIKLAFEQRVGERLAVDTPFTPADERMAKRILRSQEPRNVA